MIKIIDVFTNLPVSRQRKHQLRNPEWAKELRERYRKSDQGRKNSIKTAGTYYKKNKEWYLEYSKQDYIKKLLEEKVKI